jgi:hypothetical protein
MGGPFFIAQQRCLWHHIHMRRAENNEKICSRCKQKKDSSLFYRDSKEQDGRDCACKACRQATYKANQKTERIRKNRWSENNREKVRAAVKRYRQQNPQKRLAHLQKRRKKLKQASLNGLYRTELQTMQELAARLGLVIDHIVPLQGVCVSGLNVPWNLQLLPRDLNTKKNNWFDLEAYLNWLKDTSMPLLRP